MRYTPDHKMEARREDTPVHVPFPKIKAFRNALFHLHGSFLYNGPKPLTFSGTVKLHGTNAAVVVHGSRPLHAQSRNRVLSVDNDNVGFAGFALRDMPESIWRGLARRFEASAWQTSGNVGHAVNRVTMYGEWVGNGVQRCVGLSKLASRAFIVFAVLIDRDESRVLPEQEISYTWVNLQQVGGLELDELQIYSIADSRFPTFEISFNPESKAQTCIAVAKMNDLTGEVVRQCPVALSLGANGPGEGIVWRCVSEGYARPDLWFKVKLNATASAGKGNASIHAEAFEGLEEFGQAMVSVSRCEQGLAVLQEQGIRVHDQKALGVFSGWVVKDVLCEEADTIALAVFSQKQAGAHCALLARRWLARYKIQLNRGSVDLDENTHSDSVSRSFNAANMHEVEIEEGPILASAFL